MHHVQPFMRIDGQAVGESDLRTERGKVGMKGRKGCEGAIEMKPDVVLIAELPQRRKIAIQCALRAER